MKQNPLVGKQIGNYRIIGKIGNGTFGSVYKAVHVHLQERIVAIKLLHSAVEEPRERERFMQEAQFLENLTHPHILSLLDCGFVDVGIDGEMPYQITPFAEGGSLRDLLYLQAPLPIMQILAILAQVGQALHYAHKHKIIHRDLKPDNVLFDAQGNVLLADFGIATALERTSISMKRSEVIGTPPYMAPEQFQGIVSKESDQYSLGCIAYELLTDSLPFTAPDFFSLGFKHLTESPVPPTQFNAQIPFGCEVAVLKALAKQRVDRHASVEDFVIALQQSFVQRTVTPATERKAVVSSLLLQQEPTEIQKTKEQWVKMGNRHFDAGRYEEAVAMYEEAIRRDSNDAVVYRNKGDALRELKRYEEAVAMYEEAIRRDSNDVIAYRNKGDVLRELKRYEEAVAMYEEAIRCDPDYVRGYSNKGYALNELKRYKEALAAYDQAIHRDPSNAIVYNNKGSTLSALKRYEEALAAYEEAIRRDPNNAFAYRNKGNALSELKRYREAVEVYEEAICRDPDSAIAYNNKGYALGELMRYEEALAAYEEAIRCNPNSAIAYNNKGNAFSDLKQYKEALAAYEEAIHCNPNFAIAYRNKGDVLERLGRRSEARRAYQQARKIGKL